MPDPEEQPALRIVNDSDGYPEEVIRLSGNTENVPPVPARQTGSAPVQETFRLESSVRESFGNRSREPGMEAILEGPEALTSVEGTWGQEAEEKRPVPFGWFVLIGLLIAGAAGWAWYSTLQGKEKVMDQALALEVAQEEDLLRQEQAGQMVSEIRSTVTAYLAASSIAELLPHVRDPERVRPLMEKWYASRQPVPQKFQELGAFGALNFGTRPYWTVEAIIAGGAPRNLLVEEISDTLVRVDWETDVSYQPVEWNRFVKERPEGESFDFRVVSTPDTFFTAEYASDQEWASFRLTDTEGEEYMFGYAPAGSALAASLHFLSSHSVTGSGHVILKLRIPPGTRAHRGVVIEELVAPNWIITGAENRIPASQKADPVPVR